MRVRAFLLALLFPTVVSAATITLPAAASTHGRLGTFFHSDVAVLNTSRTATASVTARYRCFGGSCGSSPVQTFAVPARQVRFFSDIVTTLFGAPETGGAIEFESDTAIVVTSRLYTPSRPEPTVGQFVPGLKSREAFESTILTSLSHSTDPAKGFRTNVGIYNPTDSPAEVYVTLYAADGTTLGQTTRTIPARQPIQINDVFTAAGVSTDVAAGHCLISQGLSNSQPLFTYASVVDNASQDPVFVVGRQGFNLLRTGTTILPAVASLHGRLGTFFHSDVYIYRPGAFVKANYRCFGGACGNSVQQFVAPLRDGAAVHEDIVTTLFHAPETGGAIELETDFQPIVTSRLYTPSRPAPTVGQFVPAMNPYDWHFASVVTSLAHTPDGVAGFRSNVGAYNPHDVAQTVAFEVFDEMGVTLGVLTRQLAPHEGVQINDLFGELVVAREIRSGYCTVRGDGVHGIIAYGSVIDNLSQDPIFVPGEADDGCEYVLENYYAGRDETAGTQDLKVKTSPGCAWSVSNVPSWVSIVSGASGSGDGTIRIGFTPNLVSENRTGKLLIAGQNVKLEQGRGTYNGRWSGSSGLGSLSFRVSLNYMGSWTIAFKAPGSGCTIFGTVTGSGSANSKVADGKMQELKISGSTSNGSYTFIINGTFPTLSSGSGTMSYTITSGSCSSYGSTAWSATRE